MVSIHTEGDQVGPHAEQVYFTVSQAAAYLGLRPAALNALRVKGGGPRYAKLAPTPKGRVLYRRVDLDAWVESRLVSSTAEISARKADGAARGE